MLHRGGRREPPARGPFDAKAREIFEKVISIPTSLGNRKVPEMAEYLAGEFRAAGFPAEDVTIVPLKLPDDETAALVVRYRGDGSGGKPILLLAHMDVVTAKRQDWERDPFKLVEENGFFYGRGTYDVKHGITELTTLFLRLKAEKFVPKRDLIIYFSGDEETSMATTVAVANKHRQLIDAEYALNSDGGGGTLDDETGKPLFFGLQTAEKTYADFKLTTRNPGGHSSHAARRQRHLRSGRGAGETARSSASRSCGTTPPSRASARRARPRRESSGRPWRSLPPTRRTKPRPPRSRPTRHTSARRAPPASPPCSKAGMPRTRCRRARSPT